MIFKLAIISIILSGCNQGPQFKHGQYVCVTDGFYAGHTGFVRAEGSPLRFDRRYLIRFGKGWNDAEFIPSKYLEVCRQYPDSAVTQ